MLIQEKFKNYSIILASQSPRRKELLSGLQLTFNIKPLKVDESYPKQLKRQGITEYLCKKKADAFVDWTENTLLITSDTIVWYNDAALEKPQNRVEAIEMLRKLSNQKHEVITSVGVFSNAKSVIFSDITEVTFGKLSTEEIKFYVDTFQPYDKAGSYGVQEWIGYVGVKEMKGSFYTVMGLPVYKLYQVLKDF